MGERTPSKSKTSKKWKALVTVLAIGLTVSLIVNVGLRRSYDELYHKYISLFMSPISNSPPIPMSKAISIALNFGGWNESSLKGMEVNTTLYYMKIYITSKESGFEIIYPVTEPLSDYSQVRIGDMTYRYIWVVIVQLAGPGKSIPPPGYYLVDAATGEVISIPFLSSS